MISIADEAVEGTKEVDVDSASSEGVGGSSACSSDELASMPVDTSAEP